MGVVKRRTEFYNDQCIAVIFLILIEIVEIWKDNYKTGAWFSLKSVVEYVFLNSSIGISRSKIN